MLLKNKLIIMVKKNKNFQLFKVCYQRKLIEKEYMELQDH